MRETETEGGHVSPRCVISMSDIVQVLREAAPVGAKGLTLYGCSLYSIILRPSVRFMLNGDKMWV